MNNKCYAAALCGFLLFSLAVFSAEKVPEKTADELWAQALEMIEKAEESEKLPPELAPLLEQAAEKGSIPAMTQYAYLMRQGDLPGSEEKILKYLKRAADQDDAFAQYNLGMYYRDPKHQDFDRAFQYFYKAYQQKFPGSGMQVGQLFYTGKGCERNAVLARRAITDDALLGNREAQNALGVLLIRGDSEMDPDFNLARSWFEKSAKQKFAPAMNNLGVLCRMEDSIDAPKRAVVWFQKAVAANPSYAPAYRNLADSYSLGSGMEQDDQKALEMAKKGADLGDAPSMHILGMLYSTSEDIGKDDKTAFSWYLKAAEGGYQMAQFTVANMYAQGIGVDKDPAKAEIWRKKAEANQTYYPDKGVAVPDEL